LNLEFNNPAKLAKLRYSNKAVSYYTENETVSVWQICIANKKNEIISIFSTFYTKQTRESSFHCPLSKLLLYIHYLLWSYITIVCMQQKELIPDWFVANKGTQYYHWIWISKHVAMLTKMTTKIILGFLAVFHQFFLMLSILFYMSNTYSLTSSTPIYIYRWTATKHMATFCQYLSSNLCW